VINFDTPGGVKVEGGSPFMIEIDLGPILKGSRDGK
jgi:hypothetical protein